MKMSPGIQCFALVKLGTSGKPHSMRPTFFQASFYSDRVTSSDCLREGRGVDYTHSICQIRKVTQNTLCFLSDFHVYENSLACYFVIQKDYKHRAFMYNTFHNSC